MHKFLRKIDGRSWLTDDKKSLDKRVEQGLKYFRDPGDRPSVYAAQSETSIEIALAALAWNRVGRDIGRIKQTHYVIISEQQFTAANLTLVSEPSNIPWPILRRRHFVVTRNGDACTDDDLRKLVKILIEDGAEHDRRSEDVLKHAARRYSGSWWQRVLYTLRGFLTGSHGSGGS